MPEQTIEQRRAIALARARMRLKEQDQSSATGTFVREAATSVAENITGIPDLLMNAGLRMATGTPLFSRPEFLKSDYERQAEQRLAERGIQTADQFLPRLGERNLPLPRGHQVVSGVEAALRMPAAMFRGEDVSLPQMYEQVQADAAQAAMEHPVAADVGEITGDIASIIGLRGRVPGLRRTFKGVQALDLPPGPRRLLNQISTRVFSGTEGAGLSRATMRAAETGFESGVLAALDEADPEQAAAYGAGAQLAGSAMLTGLRRGMEMAKNPRALAVGAVTLALADSILPGDQSLLESAQTMVDKAAVFVGLGVLSGFAKRPDFAAGRIASNLPRFADAFAAVPRTAVTSLIADLQANDTEARTARGVIRQYLGDPSYFGAYQEDVEKMIEGGNMRGDLSRLMRDDRAFERLVFSMQPPSLDRGSVQGVIERP